MTQQSTEVMVGARLPIIFIGPGKVVRAIERLINLNVSCKLFAFVVRQSYDSEHIRPQTFNDGATVQFLLLLIDFVDNDDDKAPLSFHYRHNRAFGVGANHGILLPETNLPSKFNMLQPVAQVASQRDLTAQVLDKHVHLAFFRLNMLVKRFMTDCQFAVILLGGAHLQLKQTGGLLSHPSWNGGSVPALLTKLGRNCKGLLLPIAFKSLSARKLQADGRFFRSSNLAI